MIVLLSLVCVKMVLNVCAWLTLFLIITLLPFQFSLSVFAAFAVVTSLFSMLALKVSAKDMQLWWVFLASILVFTFQPGWTILAIVVAAASQRAPIGKVWRLKL